MTVIIPTLAADDALAACVEALGEQTWRDTDVVIVDNSGRGLARQRVPARPRLTVIDSPRNLGYGAAINWGVQRSHAPYILALNDDTIPHPEFLERLVTALETQPQAGMAAPQIRRHRQPALDSAGMLLCPDGSSKQRGEGESPQRFSTPEEVLLPSGCAALYRRTMLEEVGGFDEDFFLYCEETDLGLRARWAGWTCPYVPTAVVEHRYSHSAGRASALKAYYVERNRLAVAVKNFPLRALLRAPWATLRRYWWHARAMRAGEGAAGQYRAQGGGAAALGWMVLRAHLDLLRRLPRLLRERRLIRRSARVTASEFQALMRRHAISPREVAHR